jgi:hypothetical protein
VLLRLLVLGLSRPVWLARLRVQVLLRQVQAEPAQLVLPQIELAALWAHGSLL